MIYLILLFILIICLALVWRLRLKKVATYHSDLLGKIEVFEKYNKEKSLTINNYVQGISIDKPSVEKSYWGYIANRIVDFCRDKKSPQILMLGLGANTISGLIAKKDPRIKQTIIEIDKSIINACKEHFDLDKTKNIKVIQTDALTTNYKLLTSKVDCIIVDIFTGKLPYIVEDSNKPAFIKQIVKVLKPNGMILFNRPGLKPEILEDNKKLEKFLKTLFKETEINLVKDPRGYRNSIIVASSLRSAR